MWGSGRACRMNGRAPSSRVRSSRRSLATRWSSGCSDLPAKGGGRDRDRTCDPSRVKGVRYRCATRPWADLCEAAAAPVKRGRPDLKYDPLRTLAEANEPQPGGTISHIAPTRSGLADRRKPTLNWVLRVVVTGRGGVPGDDETIGQGLVLARPGKVEGRKIAGPLLERARSRDDGAHCLVVEHPGHGPRHEAYAPPFGVPLELLGDQHALGAPLGLDHAPVLAPPAARRIGGLIDPILAGEHTARERTIGHVPEPEGVRGREQFHLGLAIHQIVKGLQRAWGWGTHLSAEVVHVGDLPGLHVR